jgi:ubiquinone/menaquinone biosynthesis C-methylase UbiE
MLETALRPGERGLDIACGTGRITVPAATSVGDQGWVVGTDISARMAERGREESAKQDLANVTFPKGRR